MTFSSTLRTALSFAILVVALFSVSVLFAQTYTSDYVQCVLPAAQQQESALLSVESSYAQQKVLLVQQRGEARLAAWSIPERTARNNALRDARRAYRDAVRSLNRSYGDQVKQIDRTFRDAERVCNDLYDNDVDTPPVSSSSSSFSFSSSSYVTCFAGDICIPQQTCFAEGGILKNPGLCGTVEQMQSGYYCCQLLSSSSMSSSRSSSSLYIACYNNDSCLPQTTCKSAGGVVTTPYPCGNQSQINAGYACCRFISSSSSSSRSSSSSSSRSSSSLSYPILYPQDQGIQSCACETVCDPSGSPCMAVCPGEC